VNYFFTTVSVPILNVCYLLAGAGHHIQVGVGELDRAVSAEGVC